MAGYLAWVGEGEPLAQGAPGALPQLLLPLLLEPVQPALSGPDDAVASVRAHRQLSSWEQEEGAWPLSSGDVVSLYQDLGISHC